MTLYHTCRAYRLARSLPWFTQAWDLNVLIARSENVGVWDDRLLVCWVDDAGRELVFQAEVCADAWGGEWVTPQHPDGCPWTLDQHVPGGLQLGEFKGRPALRQVAPWRYVRWPGGRVPTVAELNRGTPFTAQLGTHVHPRSSYRAPAVPQTRDSQGCTVPLYQHEARALAVLVECQDRAGHGDHVSPTFCARADLGLSPAPTASAT